MQKTCGLGAVAIVIEDEKVLMIKRNKPPYQGMWSVPSGKIEFGETVEDAAVRELKEETDIDGKFIKILGVLVDHIIQNEKNIEHNFLFVCEVQNLHSNHQTMSEGEVKWFELKDLYKKGANKEFIEADILMIEMLSKQEFGYYRNVVHKVGDDHKHISLEKIRQY